MELLRHPRPRIHARRETLGKGERLQGADRSFAGMRLKDLASGADSKNLHRGNAATPATTYASTRPAQPAPRPMVEIHQGAAVQTVSY